MRHRPSSIDKMEPKVREEISRLRIDHGYTLDQIVEHLKTMDVVVARSSLGRHVKTLEDKVGARIRELRIASEAVRKAVDEGDNEKVGALNRELAHSILMRVATAQDEEGEDVQFSAQEAMFVAKALDHLASAEKKDTDRIISMRKALGSQVKTRIGAIEADVKSAGTKPDALAVLKRIREDVYGLFDSPPP